MPGPDLESRAFNGSRDAGGPAQGGVSGEVADLTVTSVPQGASAPPMTVTTFRIVPGSQPTPGVRYPISVRLSGPEALGFARNGDSVVVWGRWRHGTLVASRSHNARTGATVGFGAGSAGARKVLVRILLGGLLPLLVLGIIAVVAFKLTAPLRAPAEISLSPTSGRATTTITVNGSHFASGETVEVSVQAIECARVVTGSDGVFHARCKVPADFRASRGTLAVTATGRTSVKSDERDFTITG